MDPRGRLWTLLMNTLSGVCIVLYVVAGVALLGFAVVERDAPSMIFIPIVLLVGAMALAGERYVDEVRREKQRGATDAAATRADDPRRTVLFLRSFRDDKRILAKYRRTLLTEGEHLQAAFRELGPLIAVADPGEKLQGLGASPLVVREDEWPEAVSRQMKAAICVVIRLGDSRGVRREIELAHELLEPARVLLLNALDEPTHERAAKFFRERFGIALPTFLKQPSLVFFEEGWIAKRIPIHKWHLRGPFRATYLETGVRAALTTYAPRVGQELALPLLSAARMLVAAFLVFVLLLLAWNFGAFAVILIAGLFEVSIITWKHIAMVVFATSGVILLGTLIVSSVRQLRLELWFPHEMVRTT